MFALDAPSTNGHAIVLLCSSVGSVRDGSAPKPFGPKGWAKLSARVREAGWPGPAALFDRSSADLARELDLPAGDAERVSRLLQRRGQLAIELDRLRGRGIWVVTLADEGYPPSLRSRLASEAPPLLFGSGEPGLLSRGGIAIIGSREPDWPALEFTRSLAEGAAASGTQVVSGGARGVDRESMGAAAGRGGTVVGVLAEGLERRIREPETRGLLADGVVTLVTPYHPAAPFSAGAAMARNKVIYALADLAVVISSAEGEGGTWTGAVEALENGWVPVLVRDGPDVPRGNRALIERGARSLPAGMALESVDSSVLLELAGQPRHGVAEGPEWYSQVPLFFDDPRKRRQ